MRHLERFLSGVLVGALALTTSPGLASTFTTFDVPGSLSTTPSAINERGQIVGVFLGTTGIAHGFLLDRGTFTTIDAPGAAAVHVSGINNGGQIVGSYVAGAGTHGFLLNRN